LQWRSHDVVDIKSKAGKKGLQDQAIRCYDVSTIYNALQGKGQTCVIYLKNRMSSAVFKVGIIGIINTNTLDGRCVKTIVFTIPNFVAMGLQ